MILEQFTYIASKPARRRLGALGKDGLDVHGSPCYQGMMRAEGLNSQSRVYTQNACAQSKGSMG